MTFKAACIYLGGFLFSLQGNAQGITVLDSSYANGYYKQRVQFFRQMADEKNEIIFLGNSITEAGEWQELVPGKAVKNRGISGDVTYGVLARLDEVVASKPLKVFILIGINDLKRGIPVDTIVSNYSRIVQQIKIASPRTKIYVQSVLPVNEAMLSASYKRLTNPLIDQLNLQLKDLAMQSGCVYVNLHEIMKDENGQLSETLTSDGIHLWPSTYIHWVDFLRKKKYL